MVTNKAFIGSYETTPFNFKHFNCNYIACIKDGEQIPSKAFTHNFKKGLFIREYVQLLECLNPLTTDSVNNITRVTFAKGNTIFGFNLFPDLSNGYQTGGHVNPIKRGNLGIEIKIANALQETITILVYSEYNSILEIDLYNEVFVDYMQQ